MKTFGDLLRVCALVLLLGGCWIERAARLPSSISAELLESLCPVLVEFEGLQADQRVFVLTATRPISAMIAVEFAYRGEEGVTPDHADVAEAMDEAYRKSFEPRQVEVPNAAAGCRYVVAAGDFDGYLYSDKLLLELSNPVKNPYSNQQQEPYGVFLRFSLGGRSGAGWFWIALRPKGGAWRIIRILPLDISDG